MDRNPSYCDSNQSEISTSIDLAHGFKKANTSIFLLPMNCCFSAL